MKITKPFFANISDATLVAFSNEISIGADGWAMIAPFGDHPSPALIPDGKGGMKKVPAIQRIDKTGADQMVAGFHNERRGLRKFLKGCNIYVGHPHVPGLGKFYPDKEPKGVFADIETRADGLYGLPVFTNEGSNLVENPDASKRLKAFSGDLGESEECGDVNGVPCYRPTKIFSAGLTNTPHLPVHFFNSDNTLAEAPAEAANQPNQNNTMKKKLLALLAALSLKPQFANAVDPTEGEIETSLDLIKEKVATFANERTAFENATTAIKKKLLALCASVKITFANEAEITDAAATLDQVQAKVTQIATDLTAAQAAFANERTARIGDEIGLALSTGRITAAELPTWESRLKVEAQFANERTALRALTPKIKTSSVIELNRNGRTEQVDISDPSKRAQFANEVIDAVATEMKLSRSTHYTAIYNEATKRHPALFQGMGFKEIKMPGAKRK
ncbi:MAG TPA: hypothetical protein VG347_20300 [Verrucomicrobiae bacterium]|nr:hypothetical protein [Verrucomicrobiae bacterium]